MPPPVPPPVPPPHPPGPPIPHDTRAGDVYQKIGWLQLFNQALGLIKDGLPQFNHAIQVAVIGGPHSDIRRIWYLALSAAFGRYRNRVQINASPMQFNAHWLVSDKAVSIELLYQTNLLSSLGTSTAAYNDPISSAMGRFARGPEQLTIGGSWSNALSAFGSNVLQRRRPAWTESLLNRGGLCLTTRREARTISASLSSAISAAMGGFVDSPVNLYPVGWVAPTALASGTAGFSPGSHSVNTLRELPRGARLEQLRGNDPLSPPQTRLRVGGYPYRITVALYRPVIPEPTVAELANTRSLPTLPDDGRIITTVEKLDTRVQPPKPPLDGVSRGSLLALVAQALMDPCFLPPTPPCTHNPAGSAGLFVYNPGTPGFGDGPAAQVALANSLDAAQGTFAPGAAVSEDGYAISPDGSGTVDTYAQ